MISIKGLKTSILFLILCIAFTSNLAEAVVYNEDLQKIELEYDYFHGFGQDKVLRNKENNTWHLLKENGSLIDLKQAYLTYIDMEGINMGFHEDYYRFLIGNSYGTTSFTYVDRNGVECFLEEYEAVYPTADSRYFLVFNTGTDGYFDFGLYNRESRQEALPLVYDSLKYINDDRIVVGKDGKDGIININKDIVFPFIYNNVQYINDSFIIVSSDGMYGAVNIDNEVVIPLEYDDLSLVSDLGDYCQITKDNKSGLVQVAGGKIVIPTAYDNIKYVFMGLSVINKDGKYGIINTDNSEIAPAIYDGIGGYIKPEPWFIVFKDGLAGVLNKDGKEVLSADYIDIFEFGENHILVKGMDEDGIGRYGVFNLDGEEVLPVIYDNISISMDNRYATAMKDSISILIDLTTGKELFENYDFPGYDSIQYLNDRYYAVGSTYGGYSINNFAGQQLTPNKYSSVSLMNINNEELLAAKYPSEHKFLYNVDYYRQTKGPSSWAQEEVAKAIENNLVPFEYQSLFKSNIKRHEFCSIIVAFLQEKLQASIEEIISNNSIYVKAPEMLDVHNNTDVTICLALGMVKGRGNGIFDGESDITREEAAVILNNLADYIGYGTKNNTAQLTDRKTISDWAMDSVDFVLENNIMRGTAKDAFSPKLNYTREQAYITMYRMLSQQQ